MHLPFFSQGISAESAAIRRSQAVIEFDMAGKILEANPNFLKVVGYSRQEVVGKHHSIFVDPSHARSAEYTAFWARLNAGEAIERQFLRIGKGGTQIWLQATYTPILNGAGKPVKVVKFATDVTAIKGMVANLEGQVAAIGKSQAVIEFDLTGIVLDANSNFLAATGYALADIKGKHHGMFVTAEERASASYADFWRKLSNGEYDAGQYQRVGKSGRLIWLQASYNPILDAMGKPFKVVKYATDITQQKADGDLRGAVAETRVVVEAAKAKDLTKRVSLDGKNGDIADLCSGINDLVSATEDIVSSLGAISTGISNNAARIRHDSRGLAQRTEEQASSLEETAATTEQLAASVKQSADRVREATDLGTQANDVAHRGGLIVTQAVVAMERIEKAASGIAEIITVIDNIAFQTNLLALNAAVEAARAGDAGKGFAVVASEVRALAQRSSEAANDIKMLIAKSGEEVMTGVKLVKEAGGTLAEIVKSSTSVAAALGDISSASAEQANGIEEVAKVVAHMDDMTQQNSSMAEESASVAIELQQATEALQEMVGMFKTTTRDRDLQTHITAEITEIAPHLPKPSTSGARAASRPMRYASGGQTSGWSEF